MNRQFLVGAGIALVVVVILWLIVTHPVGRAY